MILVIEMLVLGGSLAAVQALLRHGARAGDASPRLERYMAEARAYYDRPAR